MYLKNSMSMTRKYNNFKLFYLLLISVYNFSRTYEYNVYFWKELKKKKRRTFKRNKNDCPKVQKIKQQKNKTQRNFIYSHLNFSIYNPVFTNKILIFHVNWIYILLNVRWLYVLGKEIHFSIRKLLYQLLYKIDKIYVQVLGNSTRLSRAYSVWKTTTKYFS